MGDRFYPHADRSVPGEKRVRSLIIVNIAIFVIGIWLCFSYSGRDYAVNVGLLRTVQELSKRLSTLERGHQDMNNRLGLAIGSCEKRVSEALRPRQFLYTLSPLNQAEGVFVGPGGEEISVD